jgi:hypothetical protein
VTPLVTLIRQRIAAAGPMSVAEYMALALGHPEHGYYRRRDPFGAAGDFVTAPEISQDPPVTTLPSWRLTPSRCALLSRPLRELPCPFL